jgi:hypothetical protein
MGLATIDDLKDRSLRPLTDAEQAAGVVLLEDAWAVLVAQVPSIPERVSADNAFAALVVQVQCTMVLRVLRNPDGKLEEQIDDYRWRRDSAVSTGALYATEAELALLGLGSGAAGGAWSIRSRPAVGSGYWLHPDVWVPIP